MKFKLIIRDLKTIETYDDVTDMVNRIVKLMKEHPLGRRIPTHVAIDETGMTIIMDLV